MHNSNLLTGQILNSKGVKQQKFYPVQGVFLSKKHEERNTLRRLRATFGHSVANHLGNGKNWGASLLPLE
jgi:hypothetical protein